MISKHKIDFNLIKEENPKKGNIKLDFSINCYRENGLVYLSKILSAKINKLSYYSVITGVAKSCPLRVFVYTQRSFSQKFNLTPSKILSLKMSAVLDTLHLIICNKTDGRDVHKYLKIVFS